MRTISCLKMTGFSSKIANEVFCFFYIFLATVPSVFSQLPFNEIDSQAIFLKQNLSLEAFCDANADKLTDIVLLSALDNSIQVVYGVNDRTDNASGARLFNLSSSYNVTSVVPGDFNGDLATDYLIVYHEGGTAIRRLEICYGVLHTLHYSCISVPTEDSTDDPAIVDYNGDMKPDLLIDSGDGNYTVLLAGVRNFTSISSAVEGGKPLFPQSHSFVDFDGDLNADILLTTARGIQVVASQTDKISELITWPNDVSDVKTIGMVTVADLDSDGVMDIIFPLTVDKQTYLYVYGNLTDNPEQVQVSQSYPVQLSITAVQRGINRGWSKLDVNFKTGTTRWYLSPTDRWLRSADVDNDGYNDLLVMLEDGESGSRRPFILHNVKCNRTCHWKRSFLVTWDWLSTASSYTVTQAAFYDLYNDGVLDLLLNVRHAGYTQIHVFKNNVAKESCFVSVKVGSGLCDNQAGKCDKPYVNIAGPTVRYKSTSPDGSDTRGTATQLSQATNQALQLPYVMFGLGSTPNFVDSLTVGIAKPRDSDGDRVETWQTIIPNSHLVVVPRPPDKPDKWVMHLYVTPSHLVLVTGAVVLGICGVIAILIGLLHFKERYQDKKLKQKESQRFHFNAM